jgi:hypothetical protein
MVTRRRWEQDANPPLDAWGLSIRDDYNKWRPKEYRRLVREGRAAQFFLQQQEGFHDLEERLSQQNLPAGAADEILRELH